MFINKTLRLNNLKTRTDMNAKISVLVICVEAIIYLLLYNLHDCTFNQKGGPSIKDDSPVPRDLSMRTQTLNMRNNFSAKS